jgi:CheY-like chemotaxis protein
MKPRILVVEDNPLNRELLRDWLETEGSAGGEGQVAPGRMTSRPIALCRGHKEEYDAASGCGRASHFV